MKRGDRGNRGNRGSRGERGFSLLELMVTVIIVALLASIALVCYNSYSGGARVTEAFTHVKMLVREQKMYNEVCGEYRKVNTESDWFIYQVRPIEDSFIIDIMAKWNGDIFSYHEGTWSALLGNKEIVQGVLPK